MLAADPGSLTGLAIQPAYIVIIGVGGGCILLVFVLCIYPKSFFRARPTTELMESTSQVDRNLHADRTVQYSDTMDCNGTTDRNGTMDCNGSTDRNSTMDCNGTTDRNGTIMAQNNDGAGYEELNWGNNIATDYTEIEPIDEASTESGYGYL